MAQVFKFESGNRIREMNREELHAWYRRGRWPCCGGVGYLAGPRGGAMQNIKCRRCGTIMNVIDPEDRRLWGVIGPGQMIETPEGYTPRPIPWYWRLRHWLAWM